MIAYPSLSVNRAARATRNANLWTVLLGVLGLLAACPAGAQTAANLHLAWDPSTGSGIAGYRLYQGGASHAYTNSISLGNITAATVSGLTVGNTYYFAVTAYTANGLESGYSSEITYTATSVPTSPLPPVSAPTLVAAYGFDEGSGTTVKDLSGNNNTGALVGATWAGTGRFGNALAFNETNGTAVTVNDAPSLDLTTGFTLEAWVYPTVAGSGWREIIYKGDVGNDLYYLEGSTPAGAVPAVGLGSVVTPPGTALSGLLPLPVNAWTHVAGTYDGATLQLYVNGTLVASQAKTGLVPTSAQVLSIGGDTLHGTYFTGLIDEVRLYNGALSASQIQNDMNTPVNPSVVTSPPTIALTTPANGAAYTSPATINLDANVTANGHTITKVQFYYGKILLAEETGSPYTFSWNNVSAGSYALWAKAIYDSGSTVASAAVHVTVRPGGLVAAYGFEEGSGTTVSDASGNGNTGTINGTTWTAGRYGSGLVFDGSTAVVTIDNSDSLQLTTGMTLEAWVNPSSVSSLWRDVVYKGDDNYYLEATSVNGGQVGTGGTFNANPLYGPASLPVNTWTHLAATYDGATLQLYVNGVQVASQAAAGTIATSGNPLQIGGDNFYGQYFQGIVDEVRVYNRALSAGEIVWDMNTPVVSGTASSSIAAALSSAPASVLPAPWQGIALGDGGLPGSENIAGDLYSVTGAGTLSDLDDTFRFLFQPMSGDGEISAQVGSLDGTNADGRAGVMVRETLTSGSRYAFMGISPDGTFWAQARSSTATSADSISVDSGGSSNLWVRLVRSSDTVYGYQSLDGSTWTPVATNSVPMASEIYMGFSVASGNTNILSTCTFTNATILP